MNNDGYIAEIEYISGEVGIIRSKELGLLENKVQKFLEECYDKSTIIGIEIHEKNYIKTIEIN